jgi:D-alanyl-D-alanine carboxypeptidase
VSLTRAAILRRSLCALAGAAAVVFGAATAAHAGDLTLAVRTSLQRDCTTYLQTRGTAEHISAISLSIALRGVAPVNLTCGTARFGAGPPVTPHNLYQIGSNTKAFTAVALLQMEAEGKLRIDDRLGRWLPQYPAWRTVTIRRLLNMTSGIPSYDNQPAMMHALASNPQRVFSAAELVAFVYPARGHGPKPTTGWSYSNTNYILAQMIVERASGRTYAQEIRRRFLDDPRLGLRDTYYEAADYPADVRARMVAGYFASNDTGNKDLAPLFGRDVRDDNLSWAQGAGGIVSTPEDVTRWSRALYRGPLLAPAQRREMMTLVADRTGLPIAATSDDNPRGFGLAVAQVRTSFATVWYYEGETLGYRVLYAYFPAQDAVLVVALNSQPNAREDRIGTLLGGMFETLHAANVL